MSATTAFGFHKVPPATLGGYGPVPPNAHPAVRALYRSAPSVIMAPVPQRNVSPLRLQVSQSVWRGSCVAFGHFAVSIERVVHYPQHHRTIKSASTPSIVPYRSSRSSVSRRAERTGQRGSSSLRWTGVACDVRLRQATLIALQTQVRARFDIPAPTARSMRPTRLDWKPDDDHVRSLR